MCSADRPFAKRTNGSHIEQSSYRVEAHRLRRQGRDLLRLIGIESPARMSLEGRRLLYSLALVLVAQGVQLESHGIGQAQPLLERKTA